MWWDDGVLPMIKGLGSETRIEPLLAVLLNSETSIKLSTLSCLVNYFILELVTTR